jgi:D-aminoacyl-tRNA deacylase
MRVVLQRVARSSVRVDGRSVAAIDRGVMLLVGIARGDTEDVLAPLAHKIAGLRIFEDENGKMNRALREVGGEVLAVPQFTLLGDTRKGRRPSFTHAAAPHEANGLFESFVEALRREGLSVKTGVFQAKMDVELVNDGPVTFLFDSQGDTP